LLSDRYDDAIRSAVKRDWVDFPDWLWWKAQLYQESRFDPNAKSQVGAYGLAQFMPKTWDDITHQLGWSGVSANQADAAIEAGAFYMAQLRRSWRADRPVLEKHYLGLASYNAGAGNMLKAQMLCNGARLFAQIAPCLHDVTGSDAAQTIDYVAKIQQWRRQLGL
jgi:membrane-bound lytic murein transglycosylase MltF